MVEQSKTSQDLQARLIAKAWEDESFKKALLSEPKSAIEEELGVELPDGLEIQVVEETATRICLVLPAPPEQLPDAQLAEEQLEAVAGGVAGARMRVAYTTPVLGGFGRFGVYTTTLPGLRLR
jgi:hypothetical protein